VATDLAEIVGGAVALNLLFGLPLVIGALITTAVSTALLFLQNSRSQRTFERVITGMLTIVTIGFFAGLIASPPDLGQAVAGLVPRLSGAESAVLAVGMLGATVMPHAIYLHSALIRDRHGRADPDCAAPMLRTIRLDVGLAMLVAGTVNVGMLLLAASTLFGLNVDGLQAAHSAIQAELGPLLAGLFALALLASGLASTSVGGYAGSVIMDGFAAASHSNHLAPVADRGSRTDLARTRPGANAIVDLVSGDLVVRNSVCPDSIGSDCG
jgi:manganese transport protein